MVWTLYQKNQLFLKNNKIEHGSVFEIDMNGKEFRNNVGELSLFYAG